MKIANRIVVCLLGLGVLPVMIFRELVYGVVSISQSSSLYTILQKFMKDKSMLDSAMEIKISIREMLDYLQNGKFNFGGMDFDLSKIPAELLVTKNWLIAAAVLVAVAILVAIVVAGCALFTKAYKTMICMGAGGAICSFAAIKCFQKFAVPFLDGTIDIGALLAKALIGDSDNFILSVGAAFLEKTISVDAFHIGSAVSTMMIFFVAIALWEIAFYVTLPEKDKPAKKLKKAA